MHADPRCPEGAYEMAGARAAARRHGTFRSRHLRWLFGSRLSRKRVSRQNCAAERQRATGDDFVARDSRARVACRKSIRVQRRRRTAARTHAKTVLWPSDGGRRFSPRCGQEANEIGRAGMGVDFRRPNECWADHRGASRLERGDIGLPARSRAVARVGRRGRTAARVDANPRRIGSETATPPPG